MAPQNGTPLLPAVRVPTVAAEIDEVENHGTRVANGNNPPAPTEWRRADLGVANHEFSRSATANRGWSDQARP